MQLSGVSSSDWTLYENMRSILRIQMRSTSLPPPLCHAIAGSTPLKASQRWVYKRGKEIVVDLLPPCSVTIGAEGER